MRAVSEDFGSSKRWKVVEEREDKLRRIIALPQQSLDAWAPFEPPVPYYNVDSLVAVYTVDVDALKAQCSKKKICWKAEFILYIIIWLKCSRLPSLSLDTAKHLVAS